MVSDSDDVAPDGGGEDPEDLVQSRAVAEAYVQQWTVLCFWFLNSQYEGRALTTIMCV